MEGISVSWGKRNGERDGLNEMKDGSIEIFVGPEDGELDGSVVAMEGSADNDDGEAVLVGPADGEGDG